MGTVDTGDSTSSSSDDGSSVGELSGKTVRGYYLRELLGSGGFAAVYKAYQEFQKSVGRDVAVKIILPRYANDADFIRRFEYEAQIVARLEHPFIVPLFDYWREPDAAYLVMRWLQGGSLANELRKGRLEPLRVARYLEQLAPALDYAHKHHIIHRDLKPGNLLLDRDDNVYLADFGIAKDTVNHSGVTEVGLVVGSPSYFAPEQIDGQEVGASADIYSMGIVLYELLTGYLPFTSGSITELIYKHVHEPLPSLRKYAPGLPERLELVLQRAAAKSPEDRYVSAVELAAAFRHALSASTTATQLTAVGETEPLILIDLGKHDIASPEESTQWVVALTPDNPYKGLRAFSENDADDFFGRQTLVDKLIRRLTEPEWGGRFLAVVGPSGSGKSSAVNAGLIPRLRSGAITRSDKWFITDMMPGGDPYEQLERALLKVAVKPPADMQARLRADASGLINLVGKILPDSSAELLLVIDQFEELFTQLADEAARASFLDLLYKSVTTSQSHLRVVITLRADFFDKPLHYPDFGELIRQRNEVVLPLNKQELHEAIVGPAERVGLVIGSELVETMIHDVGAQAGALPLLQFALTELYERRDGNVLSLSAYLQSGGVLGALARRADDIYNELNDERKEAARQLFLRLVTLGEGAEDTRRRVRMKEVRSSTRGNDAIEDVIDTFSRFRLLTLDRDDESREPTVEVAHEALIRSWTRLREWLNVSRDELIIHRRLTQSAADWSNAKQETSYLASGARLEQFEGWRQGTSLILSEQEEVYLNASLAERARLIALDEARRSEERRVAKLAQNFQRASIVLAVVGVLALAAMVFSLVQGNAALRQAEGARTEVAQAQEQVSNAHATLTPIAATLAPVPVTLAAAAVQLDSVQLAIRAIRELNRPRSDPQQALLLGIRSLRQQYSEDADALVVAAIDQGKLQRVLASNVDGLLFAHYSPDGTRVAVGTFFQQMQILDAHTGAVLLDLAGHYDAVFSADWSPDGKRIATGTGAADPQVRVWNAESGGLIHELSGHSGDVRDVTFAPDGNLLLSTSLDGTARLWDAGAGGELQVLAQWDTSIAAGAFSPDGKRILLCGAGGIWQLWSLADNPADPATLLLDSSLQESGIDFNSPQFSRDGTRFLLGGADGAVHLFDATTGAEIGRLESEYRDTPKSLISAAWSPDERQVAAGDVDGTIHLWNVATGTELQAFSGHDGYAGSVMFSPDGSTLLTSGNDRIVRTWTLVPPLDPRDLKGNLAEIYTLATSPDGRYLVSGGNDRSVRLYDLTSGQQLRYFVAESPEISSAIAHENSVNSVQISPDGRYVLSGGSDGFLRLWSIADGTQVRELEYPDRQPVYAGVFAPDGKSFVTTSEDGTLRRWDAETFAEMKVYSGHEAATYGVSFTSDGKFMISSSADTTMRLWNVETGELVRTIQNVNPETGEADPVFGYAATPDGKYVFAAGPNPIINVFDVQTGELVRQLKGHSKTVQTLFVSRDGKLLLSGSQDGSVRLWDVDTGEEIRRYLGLTNAVSVAIFSADEKHVIAGSWAREIHLWDTTVNDLLTYACSVAYRDLTADERASFEISESEPTCPQFGALSTPLPPTTTPLGNYQPPVWTPVHTPTSEATDEVTPEATVIVN